MWRCFALCLTQSYTSCWEFQEPLRQIQSQTRCKAKQAQPVHAAETTTNEVKIKCGDDVGVSQQCLARVRGGTALTQIFVPSIGSNSPPRHHAVLLKLLMEDFDSNGPHIYRAPTVCSEPSSVPYRHHLLLNFILVVGSHSDLLFTTVC